MKFMYCDGLSSAPFMTCKAHSCGNVVKATEVQFEINIWLLLCWPNVSVRSQRVEALNKLTNILDDSVSP